MPLSDYLLVSHRHFSIAGVQSRIVGELSQDVEWLKVARIMT
jgi:hypothetical protein